ncbi:DEAD domain-containing protein/Helicase_C domain-containing protein/DSHCT domain-containing protein/rRNA_proc-arch domain-containing protein [Cephalotus follicularis]|uniref:RNA helicase n=1 Tax=Cephalotus follicularis TaxID=3775 RepID=A0A1Q3B2A3_CEPFO|nr:DEAD domain-containing protein/Helicase_C domain-containing protein/DSHCT domain-containing protein/rRNA_proc-arch domain-containing protein [Cephalotus follicularis]
MGLLKRKLNGEASGPPQKQQHTETDNQSEEEGAISGCVHDVSYPPEGYYHVPPPPPSSSSKTKPAKEFPFTLDPFQSQAINCLNNGESVMVSAHTSAGKTVVALYAIAMSLQNNQRVVYTSPIKALSNQKYRDFKQEFSDVGLMTGDVSIDPSASCLVMTTEIWRSMLYKGSQLMREVAWVIFDEVHYMRDRERGVVWEETIVMAPKNSRFVFLSATVPNAKEFADWVAKVHQQPCHIVYTDYRPTPLQHYVFPAGSVGLYLVVDEKGNFRESSFQKALNALVPAADGEKKKGNGKWHKGLVMTKIGEETDIFKMVKMIIHRQYDPVILFSFSKRECEFLAMQMAKLDLNDDKEKDSIETIFWSAMDMLSDDDKKLPQVSNMLPLLKRGIGVHHSGLLPILKEVIEILFQEGLIKCLFATETFSIGLNMPAKTVVFTNVRKFDGDKFRWISSGEYIQMSGRAGRRGIDARGICILMVDEKLEPSTAKMMLKGSADSLNSAFHLNYNMLLNQIRCEDGDPENLLRHSFYQFQADRALPDLEREAKALEEERDSIVIEEEDSLKDYYNLIQQYKTLKKDSREIVFSPKYCLPYLQSGRPVCIQCTRSGEQAFFSVEDQVTWGVIINFKRVKSASEDDANRKPEDADYTVDVLTRCAVSKDAVAKRTIQIVPLKKSGEPLVVSIPISEIYDLSSVRLYIPKDLLPLEARENTLKKLSEFLCRHADGAPLDPEGDMKIQSNSYKKVVRKIEALEHLFGKHEIARSPLVEQKLKVLHMKQELTAKIKSIKKTMHSSTSLAFKDELKARKRVLRRLGYITRDDVVELKGKVACEISSADELTLTELMFNGVLKDISVEEMVSLLSCFVWQEKLQDAPKPREELDLLFTQLQDTARRVANLQLECKVQIDVERHVSSFRPDIMEAVYAWAKGSKFYEIMEITQVFEGSLIRAIRRLEEVLQQLILAAKSIGETEMESKFEDAVSKIKRDIVFAASLYL